MCGFAGVAGKGFTGEAGLKAVQRCAATIAHRGPDGEGFFVDERAPLALGHRRLAIIDPAHGAQPMKTSDGKLVVIFNGAIYNYLELRRELVAKGHPIASYSDTEVILYAYREWGEACVERFIGMFAFALWDIDARRLFCARDRIGIKPFYYFFDGEKLLFASEIKSILAEGSVRAESNQEGLQDYLTFQFCLDDKTLFKNIRKLEPGHCMTVTLSGSTPALRTRQYWDVQYDIDDEHDESWFVDHLAGLIEDTTRIHLRSDVPLGAHLSGGLDSSTVVCLAASLLQGERISTFTGAFKEGPQFDETQYARIVANKAGTQYHEIFIPGSELPQTLPHLMYMMDEPLAGPGVIPQYYVSQLASKHVKVVLGGQGGDEIFIGYARYLVAYLEKCLGGAIYETTKNNKYAVSLESIVPNLPLLKTYKPMLQTLWRDGLFDTPDSRYFRLVDRSEGMSNLFTPDLTRSDYSPYASFQRIFNRPDLHSLINQMTYFDLKGSLPALLHVEDRTSMARIPPNVKFAGGRMKHIFKEAVRNTVPTEIFERKDKMGFPTPIAQWTKGIANEFVRDILLSDRVRQRGIYQFDEIERAISNEKELGRVIWGLLCLELWHRIFIDGDMKPSASL